MYSKAIARTLSKESSSSEEEALKADNENLKDLAKILTMLAECVNEADRTKSRPVFCKFYIPRPNKDEVEKMAIA